MRSWNVLNGMLAHV
jgi:hypothetical protein